jgi:hypothetical protein
MHSSDKHGPRQDDELDREAMAAARSNPPVRGGDWPDPEAPAERDSTGIGAPGATGATRKEEAATPLDLIPTDRE